MAGPIKRPRPIAEEIEDEMWENLMRREHALADEVSAERLDDELDVIDALDAVRDRRGGYGFSYDRV